MLHGQRVLIIEDEPMIALDIETALIDAGAEIYGVAGTVERAWELLETSGITAAVVDLRLHGDTTRDIARGLAERSIPFMFYSGHEETTTSRRWPNVPTLNKPASHDMIVKMLAHVISAGPVRK